MFTDRFKRIPVEVFIKSEAELMGEENATTLTVKARIDPNMICGYRPDPGTDTDNKPRVVIELMDGATYAVTMGIAEFEKFMNDETTRNT